jgi:hypothetical protein
VTPLPNLVVVITATPLRLFKILHSLLPKFQIIPKKTWVEVLRTTPPEMEQTRQLFIKSLWYTWVYGLEKWRDHLGCRKSDLLKNFDEAIKNLTTIFVRTG